MIMAKLNSQQYQPISIEEEVITSANVNEHVLFKKEELISNNKELLDQLK
jgi:hypothetical protein